MKINTAIAITLSSFSLFACAEVERSQSEFVDLSADGTLDTGLEERYANTYRSYSRSSNGYKIEIGGDQGFTTAGFRGSVAMLSNPEVGDLPGSGTATHLGIYNVAYMNEIKESSNSLGTTGLLSKTSGFISMTADFANGTYTGSDDKLTVNGTFDNNDLNGIVVFDGLAGYLVGEIGDEGAVGIFHGHSDTELFAGGFITYSE